MAGFDLGAFMTGFNDAEAQSEKIANEKLKRETERKRLMLQNRQLDQQQSQFDIEAKQARDELNFKVRKNMRKGFDEIAKNVRTDMARFKVNKFDDLPHPAQEKVLHDLNLINKAWRGAGGNPGWGEVLMRQAKSGQLGMEAAKPSKFKQRLDELNAYRRQSGLPPISAEDATREAGFAPARQSRILSQDELKKYGFAPRSVVSLRPDKNGNMTFQVLQEPGAAPKFSSPAGKLIGDIKLAEKQFGVNSVAATSLRELMDADKKAGPAKNTDISSARGQYMTASKRFLIQKEAYGRIVASGMNPSPAGDLALIFNYMKVLDPGSVVRESEFATAAATGALPERVANIANRLLQGKRLSPAQRADFMERASRLFQSAVENQKGIMSAFGTIADSLNVKRELVVLPLLGEYGESKKGGGKKKKRRKFDSKGNPIKG